MKKRIVIGSIIALAGLGMLGASIYYARWENLAGNAITILTAPIKILPPHEHRIGNDVVDSITAPGHEVDVTSEIVTVPKDIWVTKMQMITKNAPASIVHHLELFYNDKPHGICSAAGGDILMLMGSETPQTMSFAPPYGIFLKKGTRLIVKGMLHNPLPPEGEGGTYHDVSIGLTLSGADDKTRYKPLSFYHVVFGADRIPHCDYFQAGAVNSFTVPPRVQHFRLQSDARPGNNLTFATFQEPGVITSMGAHLHPWEGGEKVEAYLNGVLIRTFIPRRTSNLPWSWVTPALTKSITVKTGDTITISVTYSNPTTQPITDAMGGIGFMFSPDSAAAR